MKGGIVAKKPAGKNTQEDHKNTLAEVSARKLRIIVTSKRSGSWAHELYAQDEINAKFRIYH